MKTDSDSHVLSGATFTLWNAETDGAQIALTADNCATLADGVIPAGNVNIKGLAAGTYWLQEETAPEGYNRLNTRQKVVIEKNENATVTPAEGETPATYISGGVQVINLTGSELPATGGIGTTIFYVVGGLLVLGAAVVLVARKRVDNAE